MNGTKPFEALHSDLGGCLDLVGVIGIEGSHLDLGGHSDLEKLFRFGGVA